jgi:hypothetical protein
MLTRLESTEELDYQNAIEDVLLSIVSCWFGDSAWLVWSTTT